MANEVWYRKWRPQRFGEVAGQEHITRTLANAVASQRVSHAYLFCGPRGTGKTTTARILAKAVNCEQNENGEPCNHCSSCRGVAEGRALDLIEMDAASNRGIDEIRNLRDRVGYSPTSSAYKVYLIDEVHELTQHAFDALLKTLEEPPPHVIFVLATTEAERVPATILSRCQRHDFRRIRLADATGRLEQISRQEKLTLPPGSLELIARRATGSLRDGVNLLEQVVAACGSHPSFDEVREALGMGGEGRALALARHALAGELAPAFETIAAARDEGIELRQLQRLTLAHLRALLLVNAGAESSLDVSEESIHELRAIAASADTNLIIRLLRQLSAADFRADAVSALPLELALAEALLVASEPPRQERPSSPTVAAAPTGSGGRLAQTAPAAPKKASERSVPELLRAPPQALAASAVAADTANAGRAAEALEPAPAAEPEPPPPAASSDGPINASADANASPQAAAALTLRQAQELMAGVYGRLREQRSKAAPLINSGCNIMEVSEGAITLVFKHELLAARFRTEDNGKDVKDTEVALAALSGRNYQVEVSVNADVPDWKHPPATSRTSHLLDEAEKLGLRRIERQPQA